MASKKTSVFSVLITVLGLFFILSGYFEITKNPATYPKTLLMGYPPYFILLLGIAKIVGVAALWQNKFIWLRHLAFAGFIFDVLFAFSSGIALGFYADYIKAIIAMAFLIWAYVLFLKNTSQLNSKF